MGVKTGGSRVRLNCGWEIWLGRCKIEAKKLFPLISDKSHAYAKRIRINLQCPGKLGFAIKSNSNCADTLIDIYHHNHRNSYKMYCCMSFSVTSCHIQQHRCGETVVYLTYERVKGLEKFLAVRRLRGNLQKYRKFRNSRKPEEQSYLLWLTLCLKRALCFWWLASDKISNGTEKCGNSTEESLKTLFHYRVVCYSWKLWPK